MIKHSKNRIPVLKGLYRLRGSRPARRTPLKRVGKRTRAWIKARELLRKEFLERGITACEVNLAGCTGPAFTGFAHRHRRVWYYREREKLLGRFDQVILSCQPCHEKLEFDPKLCEDIFCQLRGVEVI